MKKSKLEKFYWVTNYLNKNKKSMQTLSEQCVNDFKKNTSVGTIEAIIVQVKADMKDESLSKYRKNQRKEQLAFLEKVKEKFGNSLFYGLSCWQPSKIFLISKKQSKTFDIALSGQLVSIIETKNNLMKTKTETQKIKFRTTSRIIAGISRFVGNNINSDDFEQSKAKYISRKITQFKKRDVAIMVAELEKPSDIFDVEHYDRTDVPDEKFGPFVMALWDTKYAIWEGICPPRPDYKELGKLTRQVSPPLEAYKYTGNCPNMTFSNTSFGLLFD